VRDASVLPELQQQLPKDKTLESLTVGGANNTQPICEAMMLHGAIPVIPPRKNARIRKGNIFDHHNAAIAACTRIGRNIWKRWIGYHRRSLVETKMHCIKRLGERVIFAPFSANSTSCITGQPH